LERWIERVCEPKRLVLAWRAPDTNQDRLRWAVGELTAVSGGLKFRYYSQREFSAENGGRSVVDLREAGYLGYPAFDYTPGAEFSDHVLEAFTRRLPPRSRADFPQYLAHHRLRSDATVATLTLLGITEARLPSDGFTLVDPLDPSADACDLIIEAAGFHYYSSDVAGLRPDLPVQFCAERDNEHDSRAVRIVAGDHKVGYVNRLQASTFTEWLVTRDIKGWVLRVNGTPEKPRLFVFVQVAPHSRKAAA
jgi:hypothetical protein